jgi:hypothetical protein
LPTAEIRYWQLLIWISSVINSMSMGFIPWGLEFSLGVRTSLNDQLWATLLPNTSSLLKFGDIWFATSCGCRKVVADFAGLARQYVVPAQSRFSASTTSWNHCECITRCIWSVLEYVTDYWKAAPGGPGLLQKLWGRHCEFHIITSWRSSGFLLKVLVIRNPILRVCGLNNSATCVPCHTSFQSVLQRQHHVHERS